MDQDTTLPEKKAVAESLLTKGNVFLHLDPRKGGVVVPDWLKDQLQLVLQIGHDLPVRIPDLEISDDGVSATLSFNRSPFTCWVPWDSLFAMVGDNGRGMVWMSDMPEEIATEIEREMRRREGKDVPAPAPAATRAATRTARKSKRSGKDGELKMEADETPERLPKEKPKVARPKRRGRVAVKTAKLEDCSDASPKKISPAVSERKNRDSDLTIRRGHRKRTTRELPPYLRVIK